MFPSLPVVFPLFLVSFPFSSFPYSSVCSLPFQLYSQSIFYFPRPSLCVFSLPFVFPSLLFFFLPFMWCSQFFPYFPFRSTCHPFTFFPCPFVCLPVPCLIFPSLPFVFPSVCCAASVLYHWFRIENHCAHTFAVDTTPFRRQAVPCLCILHIVLLARDWHM